MPKLTKETLEEFKSKTNTINNNYIKVGMSTCGIAAGADIVYNFLKEEIEANNINITLKKCGCLGLCYAEPLVEVAVEGLPIIIYGRVDKIIAEKILHNHVKNKKIVDNYVYNIDVKR